MLMSVLLRKWQMCDRTLLVGATVAEKCEWSLMCERCSCLPHVVSHSGYRFLGTKANEDMALSGLPPIQLNAHFCTAGENLHSPKNHTCCTHTELSTQY